MARKNMKEDWIQPGEFFVKHKEIEKVWSTRDLGYLLYLRLVQGVKMTRSCRVSEHEVLELYKERIARITLDPNKIKQYESKSDWLTPEAFFIKHPGIKKVWQARHIGYLLNLKLIHGRKLSKGCLVSESEVYDLYKKWVCRIED